MARRARGRTANAMGVPAGMFSLVADSGVILFVSGVSNLIHPCIPVGLDFVCTQIGRRAR